MQNIQIHTVKATGRIYPHYSYIPQRRPRPINTVLGRRKTISHPVLAKPSHRGVAKNCLDGKNNNTTYRLFTATYINNDKGKLNQRLFVILSDLPRVAGSSFLPMAFCK